jgi:carbamoylphosphate synthase large subunit
MKKKPLLKKSLKTKGFYPIILSRHPSHRVFRHSESLKKLCNKRSVIRFGSSTELTDVFSRNNTRVQLNTVEAIKNSASKLRMKNCFTEAGVKTADWWKVSDLPKDLSTLPFPLIGKHIFGSRGRGNSFIKTVEELQAWIKGKDLSNYIIEKYYNFVREYRLHVSKNGCFYTCRKMLKQDTPEDKKYQRHDDNCVWIVEENPLFDKPTNWEAIVAESVKALKSTGLDFGALDLRVQSAKDSKGKVRPDPEFIIIEINSAPSMGDITIIKYNEELPKLINSKL